LFGKYALAREQDFASYGVIFILKTKALFIRIYTLAKKTGSP
jgi:hypothetical protein